MGTSNACGVETTVMSSPAMMATASRLVSIGNLLTVWARSDPHPIDGVSLCVWFLALVRPERGVRQPGTGRS